DVEVFPPLAWRGRGRSWNGHGLPTFVTCLSVATSVARQVPCSAERVTCPGEARNVLIAPLGPLLPGQHLLSGSGPESESASPARCRAVNRTPSGRNWEK